MTKTFIVVEYTDMPAEVRRAVIDYHEGWLVWSNGVYLPFNNWGNTVEGSCQTALIIERWMEENVPELKDRRTSSERELKTPVLIHAWW